MVNGCAREVDWVAAWYEIYAVWDATINFWITATFAVIIAVHVLGPRATKTVTIPIALLYTGFSLYTGFRFMGIGIESLKVVEEISKFDIDLFSHYSWFNWGRASDIALAVTFVGGTIYTIYFVGSAHRRQGNT